jgi:hypothetical protein
LDTLVEQEIAPIDGVPPGHLVLGKDPQVVGDNLVKLATWAPLPRAVENWDIPER